MRPSQSLQPVERMYNYSNKHHYFESTVGDLGDGTLNEALIEIDNSKDSKIVSDLDRNIPGKG